jgi:hypothetical protein
MQDLERPLPPPSPAAIPSIESKDTRPAFNGRSQPDENTPTTSLPDGAGLISALPEAKLLSHSSHRRANTEIIPRQQRLPVRHLFADQSKTLEDVENKDSPAENTARGKLGERAKLLSDWFQGKSEPVNFGLSRQPSAREPAGMENTGKRSPSASLTRAEKRMTPPSPLKQVTTANSFSFFGLKRQGDSKEELPEPADDEFLNLDITAALFPPGSGGQSDQDAFDALRRNADTTIRRLQAAYKQRTFALHEVMADKNEKQEELEETKTRTSHLKIQLDGMAEKVLQQDKAMKAMAEELEQERQLRQRESESRRHSMMLVKAADDDTNSDLGGELRAPTRSLKRASNCTLASDSGCESGDESVADSVFSHRDGIGSPRSTITVPSPNVSQIALSPPTSTPMMPAQKDNKPAPAPPQHQSAYDRVLKGLASSGLTKPLKGSTSGCANCYGVPASEAWSVMGVLKDENRGLKGRLGELEVVIDDCLNVVGP